MIRWQFIFSRLVIIVLILVVIRWGMGPLAGYITVLGIESTTGAKAEIAETRVGLFPPRIQYTDVRIADPRDGKEMQDAFRADSIDLVIDGDALLHRRFVASDGRVTGITVGSDRQTSGHYEPEPTSPSDGPSFLDKLVSSASGQVSDAAGAIVDDLETTKRATQIRQRWESDYETLLTKASQLEKQIRDIRDRARQIMSQEGLYNQLRDQTQLPKLLEQAMQTRNELLQIRAAIDAIPAQVQADLIAMEQAKQIDLDKVDAYIPGSLAESKNFGIDLIAHSARDQIQRVRDYLENGRTIANYTVVAPENERFRGFDFDLRGDKRLPNSLVRRCEVGGLMRVDGSTYEMKGVLENLTPTPELLPEPTVARLQLEGPQTVRVELTRDQRGGRDLDRLTVHWPEMQPDPMQLGNSDQAKLVIDGGKRELWIQIVHEDGKLDGRMVSKQVGVDIGLEVDGKVGQSAAIASLHNNLRQVDRIEIDARFAGTWKDLHFDVTSNLGQLLTTAVRSAMQDQVAASKRQMSHEVVAAHAEKTAELQNWLASNQGKANDLLRSADESIQEISQKVSDEANRIADRAGDRLRKELGDLLR